MMFSTEDVEKSKIFKSVSLINIVTCVKFIGRFLLAGVGNVLMIYDTDSLWLCERRKIFNKTTIHGIYADAKGTRVAVHGENYASIFKMDTEIDFLLEFESILQTNDWICNILWMSSNSLLTVSANNVATVWSIDLKKEIRSSSCDERCILYSATSLGEDEANIIVFSGTVFKEIVIWSPFRRSNGSNILHRLKKHEGVIFSITVNQCESVISSTSDDRSTVIWNVEAPIEYKNTYDHWNNAKITSKYSLYAHKARVWKSIVMQSGNILSAGEDGQICLKTSSLTYQWEESRGSQVRCLDCMEHKDLVASGCTSGSVGLWSLTAIPKSNNITDSRTNGRYSKHLVVFSNTDSCVLFSDGQIVYYKSNSSNDVYQDDILCCTLTMVKSPCETRVAFTTSNGYMIIIKNTREKFVNVFMDKISPVKIVSTVWLNNNQIITCNERNKICLYDVIDDLECDHLNHLATFCINTNFKCWITFAVKISSLIFAGCNEGSMYLFKLNQKDALQVFSKIHGFSGVTGMYTHEQLDKSTIVSSFGRDGHHRYWNISTESETVFLVRCEILPTKWPFMITNSDTHGLLICGFKGDKLIVYSSMEQRILATTFCGGGHRAWDLAFVNSHNSLYFVCSTSNNKIESKEIPLYGQHMLLKGFHSMIINSMAQINDDLMISASDDTTVRIARFNSNITNLLTIRSHISSVRSVSCLTLSPCLHILVTVGGRAQMKIWTLRITDNGVYCEESVSYLLKSKIEKKPWRSVVPSNEGETRFMDVSCVLLAKSNSVLISVGCSDAILRLYNYKISEKTLNLIEESSDCNNCVLKILKIQLNTLHYILTTDTKGYVNFWDLTEYIENNKMTSISTPKYKFLVHQSGINCCDWMELDSDYGMLATGGDDECLGLSIFHYKDSLTILCDGLITLHCSQVTGTKLFKDYVISTSVDQKIIFHTWRCDLNSKTIEVFPFALYFTTVADIHGLLAQQIGNEINVVVYGQGVEMICADVSLFTPSSQVDYTVKRVSPALELGEGPHWNPRTQSLYFVDLHRGKINRYPADSNKYYWATIEGYTDVTFVIPFEDKDDTFMVGLGPSIGVVTWDGISNKTSKPRQMILVDESSGNRLNDAKADAYGRLWVGSMGPEIEENPGHYHKHRGSLYSVELDGTIIKRLKNISISNGMAWSSDNKKFYYVDTYSFAVESYDFDIATGELSNNKVIFNLVAEKIKGDPDGMTIDTDGNLWVACFNSNHILKINPITGKLLMEVQLPAYQVTSAAFGGPKLDQLFVTTAGYQLTEAQKSKQPYSGAVFCVTNTGSSGFPGLPVKVHMRPESQLDTI